MREVIEAHYEAIHGERHAHADRAGERGGGDGLGDHRAGGDLGCHAGGGLGIGIFVDVHGQAVALTGEVLRGFRDIG